MSQAGFEHGEEDNNFSPQPTMLDPIDDICVCVLIFSKEKIISIQVEKKSHS